MKATRRFNAVAIVVAATLGLAAGSAQAEFFLKLGAIKGESTDPRHKDEIVVDSFQWGMGRTVATSMSFGGATLGKLCVSAITLTKQTDLATTSLIANTASGMNIAKAILIGRRSTGDAESFEYFRIELDNVKVGRIRHQQRRRPPERVLLALVHQGPRGLHAPARRRHVEPGRDDHRPREDRRDKLLRRAGGRGMLHSAA